MITAIKNFFFRRAQKKRQKLGGRWERWNIDAPLYGTAWFQHNSLTRGRPHVLCRGTPVVEIYDPKI